MPTIGDDTKVRLRSLLAVVSQWPPEPLLSFCRDATVSICNAAITGSKEERMPTAANRIKWTMAWLTSVAALWASPGIAKECYAPDARSQERAFSRAVTTEGGKAIWLGGQTGSPDANFETQTRQIFESLDKTIKAVGGSGLNDMVTMTVFITDVRHGDRLTQVRKEIFKDCFPGSALITVTGLAVPGLLIEIQGIAVIGAK